MNAAELLKEKLTDEEFAAFDAALSKAVAEKVAEAIAQTKLETSLKPVVMGLLKSVTVWLGAVMATMPEWWPLIQDQVTALLGQNAAVKVVGFMGILTILARFKTTKSLRDKGTPNA